MRMCSKLPAHAVSVTRHSIWDDHNIWAITLTNAKAVPQLTLLDAGFLPQGLWLNGEWLHVKFAVEEVVLDQGFLQVALLFSS
jgi:hypothetical protein